MRRWERGVFNGGWGGVLGYRYLLASVDIISSLCLFHSRLSSVCIFIITFFYRHRHHGMDRYLNISDTANPGKQVYKILYL